MATILVIIYVTHAILAGNLFEPDLSVVYPFVQVNAEVWHGAVWMLFTSMFLHANLLHLGGNVFFLLLFGTALEEQVSVRRLEAFLKVTRDAFLNLPREGKVQLRFSKSPTGAPVPEIIFEEATGMFGVPSLGGGSLILAARPQSDGSRTMSLLRVPKDVQGTELENLKAGNSWIPLLPRVEMVKARARWELGGSAFGLADHVLWRD